MICTVVFMLLFYFDNLYITRIIGHSEKIIGVDVSDTQIDVARKSIVHESLSFEQVTFLRILCKLF